jgi:DNA-binding GntR family transcriptional regulator
MGLVRYKHVVDALAADIRTGRLRPATRLPTHRALAAKYGLALGTASRVYAELEAIGLVVGETGRGTFVRDPSYPRPARPCASLQPRATWNRCCTTSPTAGACTSAPSWRGTCSRGC